MAIIEFWFIYQWLNLQWSCIGSVNRLAQSKREAIIWPKGGLMNLYICASFVLDELEAKVYTIYLSFM